VWAFYNYDPILMRNDAHWSVRRMSNNVAVRIAIGSTCKQQRG